MSHFLAPGRLWLLLVPALLLAAYVALQLIGKQRYAVRFSNVDLLDKIAPARPGWRKHLLAGLMILALICAVIGLARPRAEVDVATKSATIMLAIDVSLSMEADDVDPNRVQSAEAAAKKFVGALPENIQVGLILFDGTAELRVSPTDDKGRVLRALDNLELGEGTAIGDAVALGVGAIEASDRKNGTDSESTGTTSTTDPSGSTDPNDIPIEPGGGSTTSGSSSGPAKSITDAHAAVIVLSDGETTMGRPTEDAIPIAQAAGVPVWTISYGTSHGEIVLPGGISQPVPVKPEPLRNLANQTGGKAFEAESAEQLNQVYKQLSAVVKSEKKLDELTWRWMMGAFWILVLSMALSMWWFHRMV